MSKEVKEEKQAETREEKSSYEKLRDELFETRVDLRAWVRSIRIIMFSVAILFGVFAYFGYDKIQSIEKAIIDKANARLAKTDEILAKIDEKKLNQINKRLTEKEKEFERTIASYEKVLSKNRELEEKLLNSLEPNESISAPKMDKLLLIEQEDVFQIRPFSSTIRANSKQDIYITFRDKFALNDAELLEVSFFQKKSQSEYMQIRNYYFKVQQRLNKLSFTVNIAPGNYFLRVGYLNKLKAAKDGTKEYSFYSNEYAVKVEP